MLTTEENLQSVQEWIEEKRSENNSLRAMNQFYLSRSRKRTIQLNSDKIALAEGWLANYRAWKAAQL